jgi:plastocyanin
MRRVTAGVGLTVALVVAPAWGATSEVKVENYAYTPATVTVDSGDSVTWRFTGPNGDDTNHSITADPGQAETFDSDPGPLPPLHSTGYTYTHKFTKPGRFTYYCKPHPYMKGAVVVRGGGGGGASAPRVSGLAVKGGRKCRKRQRGCRSRKTRIAFRLSKAAKVRIAFKRKGGGKSPKAVVRQMTAGQKVVRLSTKRVPRGRYALTLRATDSGGNASAPAKRSFRVR